MRARIMVALLLVVALPAWADEWALPEPQTFESADGQWRLVVTPKQLESQLAYFSDKVDGKADAGAALTIPDNRARAELYRREAAGTWTLAQRWALVNEVAPVSALVANDGTVVTFDHWHAMGYGDDVVVIYRSDGQLVRQLGLSALLEEEDIFQLRHSVSSIWWSGEHRIDEKERLLVLQIDAQRMEELPLSLDTGALRVPKRVMFPRPKVSWAGEDMGITTCGTAYAVRADELVSQATMAALPDYPEVARKARIAGNVVLDITIDEDGKVEDVIVLKPLPFGIDQAARDAVRKWRFRPLQRDGNRVKACGRVRMTFDLTRF